MLFASATTHALRALSILEPGGPLRLAKDLAAELAIPGPYLAKVLQALAQAGVLQSVRGPKGGFRLIRDPEALTVAQIVDLLEGGEPLSGCILGLAQCGRTHPCPMHEAWGAARKQLQERLQGICLGDLQRAVRS